VLYNNHIKGAGTFDFMSRHVLSAPLGVAYDVGVDGISLFMVVLTALVLALALLGCARTAPRSVLRGLDVAADLVHDG
jgi:NADH:ubiquinone oxidoreductase subunit 4 (subunit M)